VSPRFRDTGKVARARVIPPQQPSLFEPDPGDEVRRILVPGASTERYGRIWHVGRTEVEDGILYGRLGFEGSGLADLWSEDDKDFQETRTPAGVAAPFAIQLTGLRMVFQTRGQDIRVTSFVGAMQGILRDATGQSWRIETDRREVTFAQWRSTVEKVTQMRFTVEPPNPNYEGRPDLERLIEGASLSAAEIVLRSEDGIVTDADIVTQLLDHAERGYGRDVAVGERTVDGEVVESVYSSELHGETEVAVRPANPETGEVERETLRQELTRADDTGHAGEHGRSASPGTDHGRDVR
jgi:hypothetical protein